MDILDFRRFVEYLENFWSIFREPRNIKDIFDLMFFSEGLFSKAVKELKINSVKQI